MLVELVQAALHLDADSGAATLPRGALRIDRADAETGDAVPARTALFVRGAGSAGSADASLPAATLAVGRARLADAIDTGEPGRYLLPTRKCHVVAVGKGAARTTNVCNARLAARTGIERATRYFATAYSIDAVFAGLAVAI
jgi:hypothetical protein